MKWSSVVLFKQHFWGIFSKLFPLNLVTTYKRRKLVVNLYLNSYLSWDIHSFVSWLVTDIVLKQDLNMVTKESIKKTSHQAHQQKIQNELKHDMNKKKIRKIHSSEKLRRWVILFLLVNNLTTFKPLFFIIHLFHGTTPIFSEVKKIL